MKQLFLLLALTVLLLGCPAITEVNHEGGTPSPPSPDYSYDLIAKDIHIAPDYPQLTEEYKMRVVVQRYGAYSPNGYSVWILDGNTTLLKKDIFNPDFVESFEFDCYAGDVKPHNIRVEVQSLDFMHPEPESNLENNVLREDIGAYPFGYYDIYNWKISWFYDAVGMQVYQAQAFTLENPLNLSRIGVYVQANVPPPPGSVLRVSLHEKPTSWGNLGVGEQILAGEINAAQITNEASWQHIEFEKIELTNDTYWIMLSFDSPSGAGIEWYRAEGNPFGTVYDTQMFDRAGYGEWEYKGFDFAFKID